MGKIKARRDFNFCMKGLLENLEEYCVTNYSKIEQNEALINLYQELVDVINIEKNIAGSELERIQESPCLEKTIALEKKLSALIDFVNDDVKGLKAILSDENTLGSIAYYDSRAQIHAAKEAVNLRIIYCCLDTMDYAITVNGILHPTLDIKKNAWKSEEIIEMWTKMEKKGKRKEIADAKKYVKSQNKLCGKTVYSVDENGLITIAEDYKPFPQLGNRANEILKKIEIVRNSAPQRTFSKEQLDYALSIINGEECPFPYTEIDKDNLIIHSILKGTIVENVPQVGMTCYRSVVDDYKTKKKAQIKKEYAIRCRNIERDIDMINKELERAVELYAVKKQLLENLPKEAVNPILYEELEDLDNRINKLNKKLIIEKDCLEAMKKRENEAYAEL